jgi:hypothetical protein
MAGASIRNTSTEDLSLPFPLSGVLFPGQAVVVNASAAQLAQAGIASSGTVQVLDLGAGYTGPYSPGYQGDVGSQNVFVSPTGSDGNPGTQAAPLLTLDAAIAMLPDNGRKASRIYLAPGTTAGGPNVYTLAGPKNYFMGSPYGSDIAADRPTIVGGFMADATYGTTFTNTAADPNGLTLTAAATSGQFLGIAADALIGKFMFCVTGAQAGKYAMIVGNSVPGGGFITIRVKEAFGPIANTDTFQVQVPSVQLNPNDDVVWNCGSAGMAMIGVTVNSVASTPKAWRYRGGGNINVSGCQFLLNNQHVVENQNTQVFFAGMPANFSDPVGQLPSNGSWGGFGCFFKQTSANVAFRGKSIGASSATFQGCCFVNANTQAFGGMFTLNIKGSELVNSLVTTTDNAYLEITLEFNTRTLQRNVTVPAGGGAIQFENGGSGFVTGFDSSGVTGAAFRCINGDRLELDDVTNGGGANPTTVAVWMGQMASVRVTANTALLGAAGAYQFAALAAVAAFPASGVFASDSGAARGGSTIGQN